MSTENKTNSPNAATHEPLAAVVLALLSKDFEKDAETGDLDKYGFSPDVKSRITHANVKAFRAAVTNNTDFDSIHKATMEFWDSVADSGDGDCHDPNGCPAMRAQSFVSGLRQLDGNLAGSTAA